MMVVVFIDAGIADVVVAVVAVCLLLCSRFQIIKCQ